MPPYDRANLLRTPAEVATVDARHETWKRCGTNETRQSWQLTVADDYCALSDYDYYAQLSDYYAQPSPPPPSPSPPPPSPSPPPPGSLYSWFDSSEHCSTSDMQSFGWTVNQPSSSCSGGYYLFYRGGSPSESISIPLPTGFSDATIEYGQSCYYPDASVNVQLNGVVMNSVDTTCVDGLGLLYSCYIYPPVESCLKTFSMKYSPGDVLTIQKVGVSIAYIKTIK
eukprot:scaffold6059_cov63-Phaeocystis_antarctica.AAC.1